MREEPSEDLQDIALRVKSGEYFREMRQAYGAIYLDPMATRYFYMVFSTLCVLILLFMSIAFWEMFPLSVSIPFLYYSQNTLEDLPVIRPLKTSRGEDTNRAIKRYMAAEYVRRRESYDIDTLELNVRFVRAQSAEGVYNAWQQSLDPANPESPIAQYQRQFARRIEVHSTTLNPDGSMEVDYTATVADKTGGGAPPKAAHLMATLAFQYTDVTMARKTGEKTALHFVVTDYRTRRLQE